MRVFLPLAVYCTVGLALAWLVALAQARFAEPFEPWYASRAPWVDPRSVCLPKLNEQVWRAPGDPSHIEFRPLIRRAWQRALADRLLRDHIGPEAWEARAASPWTGYDTWAWRDGRQEHIRWVGGVHLGSLSFGWPVASFESWYFIDPSPANKPLLSAAVGVPIGTYEHDNLNVFSAPRVTPLMPVWPGVALSAALYGAGAFALLHTPRTIRAVLRRYRGACHRCGYSMGGIGGAYRCPECGTDRLGAVSRKA